MQHILFKDLPTTLQEKIIWCLQTDDFVTAKCMRDKYERQYLLRQSIKNLAENNTAQSQINTTKKKSHLIDVE